MTGFFANSSDCAELLQTYGKIEANLTNIVIQ